MSMKILSINKYRDGGTVIINTDNGHFCIDNRMFTKTKHRIFNGYPEDNNSNIIENDYLIRFSLWRALVEYPDTDNYLLLMLSL